MTRTGPRERAISAAVSNAPVRSSAQGVLDAMMARYAAANETGIYSDLLAYISTGAWSGSDAQLQTRASGLAHLIVGSAEYQFV